MTSKEIKKVVQQTKKELEQENIEKQTKQVKEIVRKTLQAIEDVKKQKDNIDKKLRYLKMDLDDLKAGHLERIEERQEKDPEAKKCSVVIIIKEKEVHHHHYDKWYSPYYVNWNTDYVWTYPQVFCGNSDANIDDLSLTYDSSANDVSGMSINCSIAKDASVGTYDLGEKVINFR